jgi:hypothetical protein
MLVFIDTEGEMQIKSLDQMETIVEKNSILSWDGWNVVEMYVSDKGATSKFGAKVASKEGFHSITKRMGHT